MRRAVWLAVLAGMTIASVAGAQEANSGVDVRATLTAEMVGSKELTQAPRNGSPVILGGHGVLYPTLKFNNNLYITAALQGVTRPYYYSELSTPGYGVYGRVLQATLNYSRISSRGSMLLRAGQMSTAFGSFLLRYDDAENALVDLPPAYGYYYAAVSMLGVAGAQIDATKGRFDGRVQFANSSPANPRSVFAHDQYGNWAGGGGYTIRQGLRVGASGYRGAYLDRKFPFYFPGEAKPSTLPAYGLGMDADWAHGHTRVYAELQRFVMTYKIIPNFRESAGYGEVKQVLAPRWFVAGRYSYLCNSVQGARHTIESAAGFRPNRLQIVKAGYEWQHYRSESQPDENRFAVQLITTLQKSLSRN
jgi:hypothetical protein